MQQQQYLTLIYIFFFLIFYFYIEILERPQKKTPALAEVPNCIFLIKIMQ